MASDDRACGGSTPDRCEPRPMSLRFDSAMALLLAGDGAGLHAEKKLAKRPSDRDIGG